MTLQQIKQLNRDWEEEFEKLEVSYNLPTGKKLTESLLLNDEQEAVIKNFISLCETRLLEGVVEMIDKQISKVFIDYPDTPDGRQSRHENRLYVSALSNLKQSLTKEIK